MIGAIDRALGGEKVLRNADRSARMSERRIAL